MVCLSLPRKLPQIPTDLPWRKIRPTRRRRPQGIATCTSCFSCADLSCVSSFRRGNLQHRRAHRSRAAFQFTLFPGHWTDRLDRSRLSLIWLPWSSGSSACIPWPPRSCCLAFSASSPPPASPSTLWAAARWVRKSDSSRRACPSRSVIFHLGRASGTRSSTAFFPSSHRIGAGEPLRDYETVVHLIAKTSERAASDLPIGPPQISNRPRSQQVRNEGHPSSTG